DSPTPGQCRAIEKMVEGCRSELQMRPTLPLGQPISLGTVGYLNDHAFHYLGTTEIMLGREPGNPIQGTGLPDVQISSGKDVSLSVLANGETSSTFGKIANLNGSIELSFNASDSFVVAAKDISITAMQNPILLFPAMIDRYTAGAWKEEYCFIYQIGTPTSFTAVISRQSGSRLLLDANTEVGEGAASLGDLAVGASFQRQSGAVDKIVCRNQVPAFFNAYRVKKPFLRKPKVVEAAAMIKDYASAEEIAAALGFDESPFESV
ncbi:hypothetical protein, partial [Leifsonia sp. NPDC058248]|uniref:hypothetical protein n=1 Tax=Leifsonia sp. NPDC058248 TaxID=3346402 RepID=UPI0036DF5531